MADRMMNGAWRRGTTRSGSYASSCSQYYSEEWQETSGTYAQFLPQWPHAATTASTFNTEIHSLDISMATSHAGHSYVSSNYNSLTQHI